MEAKSWGRVYIATNSKLHVHVFSYLIQSVDLFDQLMIGNLNAFIPACIRIFINHTLYDKTHFLHVQLGGPDGIFAESIRQYLFRKTE